MDYINCIPEMDYASKEYEIHVAHELCRAAFHILLNHTKYYINMGYMNYLYKLHSRDGLYIISKEYEIHINHELCGADSMIYMDLIFF